MKVYSGQSIKRIEQACFDAGMTELRLMENAGVACAKVIRREFALEENKGKLVAVLCGKGKNGGDGFVIARKLSEIGAEPVIILTHAKPTIAEPVKMLERAESLDIRVYEYAAEPALCKEVIAQADLIVDCMFGIGYRGLADERTRELFEAVNASPAKVAAVDVPSGLDSEGVNFDPAHIRADLTVSISAFKPVHILEATAASCGKLVVVGINIAPQFFEAEEAVAEITDKRIVRSILPARAADANKGSFGHLLLVCGSYRMPGAAVFSAGGAVRSGVGKITLAFPQPAYPAITSKLNEPLFLPLAADEKGFFDVAARDALVAQLSKMSAVAIGCGIGTDIGAQALLETVCKRCKGTILVDADGINLLSENMYLLEERKAPTVLTPHLGEFSKLMDKPIEDIKRNRAKYAKLFCEQYPQAVLVLKGNNTIIAKKGEILYINPTGNPGLAQGGTGDVLAGLIAGLAAQGISPFESAVAGAFIHGDAGDLCAAELSQRAMSTDDLVRFLPSSLIQFEE
ncbi:MAG: NAD(P)H-hydrate dehydratase [Clostridia bacterium]|nr:NAD(P)H-hydrate dehydratase [Clostridia bacterium]